MLACFSYSVVVFLFLYCFIHVGKKMTSLCRQRIVDPAKMKVLRNLSSYDIPSDVVISAFCIFVEYWLSACIS